VNEEAKDH